MKTYTLTENELLKIEQFLDPKKGFGLLFCITAFLHLKEVSKKESKEVSK